MSNCIDCKWAIQLDENKQCKKASPEVRDCENFEKVKRYVNPIHLDLDYRKMAEEQLE